MNVLIQGQEAAWTLKLKELCRKDHIYFYEKENEAQDIQLVVTGFPIEKERKGIYSKIPFLVVSREKREDKILEAFEAGAEDYMVYPVSPRIARARILRILNHCKMEGDYLEKLQSSVHFTPNEYKILSFLMTYPGKVFSRNELIESVFSELYEGYDRNVDNYIKQIRKKLAAETSKGEQIETVYGVGYRYMP